jgi:hypothetical protein
VRQATLTQAQVRGLYPQDGWDLLVKLLEPHEHMVGVEEGRVAKAEKRAVLVMKTSKALEDLGLPPIQGLP